MTETISLSKMPIKDLLKINQNSRNNDQSIILEGIKVENRFKKVKIELNNELEQIALKKNTVIKIEEFEKIRSELFSNEESIETLEERLSNITNIYRLVREAELIKISEYADNLLIDSSFTKKFPESASFLKNFLLRQISLKYFSKKSNSMKEKIIDQIDFEQKKPAFLYFSTNAVETLKLSKINEIVNNQGEIFKIKEIFQSNDHFKTKYQIGTKEINISIPIFYGILICEEK